MNKHIITADQFTRMEVEKLFGLADYIRSTNISNILQGLTLATLFYEPSTRTRLSFESAMHKLGGNVISVENAQFSSVKKGESLADTIKTISLLSDCIVLRHPDVNSAQIAVKNSNVPIINGGSGYGEHPTQALLDLYTVQKEIGKIDNLHYVLVGDIKYGRTVHSLVKLLSLFKNIKITEVEYSRESLHQALRNKPDVIYLTRVQLERMTEDEKKVSYHFGVEELRMSEAIIMHPLPKNNEIAREVDESDKAVYFKQVENGLWLRAALLYTLLR